MEDNGQRASTFASQLRRVLTYLLTGSLVAIAGAIILARGCEKSCNKARVSACSASIRGVGTALQAFRRKAGRFPTTAEGLDALTTAPASLKQGQWDGPYLGEVPKDSWGQRFIYCSPGSRNKDYDLMSKGPDKQQGTDDDIIRGTKPEYESP